MLKVTLFLQRKAGNESNDDSIRIYEDDSYIEMYKVVYSTCEVRRDAQFYMTRGNVVNYVSDLLKSLKYDSEPFEFVQITTAIQPSILFHLSDLDNSDVRHLIEDSVSTSMKVPVELVKRKLSQ